jgi:hypothetical protein
MHKLANYYPLRNHLIDFLVTRSRELAGGQGPAFDPKHPPIVRPTARAAIHAVETTSPEPSEAYRVSASPVRLAATQVRGTSRRIDATEHKQANGRPFPSTNPPARNRPLELIKPKWR